MTKDGNIFVSDKKDLNGNVFTKPKYHPYEGFEQTSSCIADFIHEFRGLLDFSKGIETVYLKEKKYFSFRSLKSIVRHISNISGVTEDIKKEVEQGIGNNFIDAHYWFNDKDHRVPVGNALKIIGSDLQRGYNLRANTLRDEIDKYKFNRKD